MKTLLSVALLATIAFTLAVPAFAAQPTQADFDACNRAAQGAVSSPSASPQAGGAASPQAGGVGPGGATGPMGSGPGGAPAGGVTTGPSVTTPAGTPGPMITGSGRQPGSTGGVREGTGAVSKDAADAQLSGMADRGTTDSAYKTAYQDCMKQRGF